MLQEQWNNVLSCLQNQVTAVTFDLWITKLKPVSFHNDELVLVAPNNSVKHQVTSANILSKIQSAVHKTFNMYTEVRIVEENELQNLNHIHIVEQSVDNKVQSTFNKKYTFYNFVVGKSNQFVHAAMRSVAENPSSKFNPLFIYGGVGLGKTHLLHAVGNYLAETRPELNVLYATCEKFTNDYTAALRSGNRADMLFREKYRNVDVLMIDDIQFISNKMSIQEEFFNTFNDLYQNNKQIIIASDRSPKEISALEERLKSRFSSGLIQDLQTPDYETRVAILSTKASQEGYLVDDEVIDFIAQKLDINIREMEGLLSTVVFYSQLKSSTCATMEHAREALKDINEPEKESLDAEKIIQSVCQFFNISKDDMFSRKRNNEIAEPRQLCMYLISDMIDMPLMAIGKIFNRDHSTVVHARDKISSQIRTNQKTKTIISDLKSQILKH